MEAKPTLFSAAKTLKDAVIIVTNNTTMLNRLKWRIFKNKAFGYLSKLVTPGKQEKH